jgi:hypothetical protein
MACVTWSTESRRATPSAFLGATTLLMIVAGAVSYIPAQGAGPLIQA